MDNLKINVLNKEVVSPIFIGAGPNTEDYEKCVEAIECGAGAIECPYLSGYGDDERRFIRTDPYQIIPNARDAFNGHMYGFISTGRPVKAGKVVERGKEWGENINRLAKQYGSNHHIVASIGRVGYKGDDKYNWGELAKKAEEIGASALTLHIQTGNAMAGGFFAENPDFLKRIVTEAKSNCNIPVIAKLPIEGCVPSMLANEALKYGADAVAPTGRFIGLIPDIDTGECTLGGHIGYGGNWVMPNICAWTARIYQENHNRIIIPGGGVSSWQDIVKALMSGATMTQACTWVLTAGYGDVKKSLSKLSNWLLEKNYTSINDVIGKAANATASVKLWESSVEQKENIFYGIQVEPEKCKGCKICLNACFFESIKMYNGKAKINLDTCMGCGCCKGICPFKAIG